MNGASWFSTIGTDKSRGTKVISVSGDVEKPGIYELVMGSDLKELMLERANAKGVKAVQVGGAAGRIIPASMIDTPLSFETVLGSGAVTVLDESSDIINMIYRTVEFFAEESCEGSVLLAGRGLKCRLRSWENWREGKDRMEI